MECWQKVYLESIIHAGSDQSIELVISTRLIIFGLTNTWLKLVRQGKFSTNSITTGKRYLCWPSAADEMVSATVVGACTFRHNTQPGGGVALFG